jgi:hypothetical protein
MSEVNLEGIQGCMCTNAGKICATKEQKMTEDAIEIMEAVKAGRKELTEDDVVSVMRAPNGHYMMDEYLRDLGIDMRATHPTCCTYEQLAGWLIDKKSGYPQLISLLASYLKNGESVEVQFMADVDPAYEPVKELRHIHVNRKLALITINSVLTEKGRNPIKPGEQISKEDLEMAISHVGYLIENFQGWFYAGFGKVVFAAKGLVAIERPVFDRNLQSVPLGD